MEKQTITKSQVKKVVIKDLVILFYYIANIFFTYYTWNYNPSKRWLPDGIPGLILLAFIVGFFTLAVFYIYKPSLIHFPVSIGIVILYYIIFPKHYVSGFGGVVMYAEYFLIFCTFLLELVMICIAYSKAYPSDDSSNAPNIEFGDVFISSADKQAIERKLQICIDAVAHREPEILADQFCPMLKNDIDNTLFTQIQKAFDMLGEETITFTKRKTADSILHSPQGEPMSLLCCERGYDSQELKYCVKIMLHFIWENHPEFSGIGYIRIKDTNSSEIITIGSMEYPYSEN